MIESIGRNIGIRRSEGDYIISTNIDIISSPINNDLLSEDVFYTVPRRDIDEQFHLNYNNFDELYSKIWNNRNSYQPKNRSISSTDVWSLINCCGDYQIGHKTVWEKMKGFEESIFFGCGIDTNVMKKASFYSQIKVLDDHYIFHLNHGKTSILDYDEKIPPISNQKLIIEDFINTSNSDDWGMYYQDLPIELI
jgi:hypothetical protein